MNITIEAFPKCQKESMNGNSCNGTLLPFEDTSKEGIAFLKGWACNKCDFNIMCNLGKLAKTKIDDYSVQR